MMLAALAAGGLFGLGFVVAVAFGRRLPKAHSAERTAEIAAPSAAIWSIVSDCARYPEWVPGVKSSSPVATESGRPRWRFATTEGPLRLEIVDVVAERRFAAQIVDDGLPFGGSWAYELRPCPGGTRVCLREEGWIESPAFRFLARYVFGYERTVDETLAALKRRVERLQAN